MKSRPTARLFRVPGLLFTGLAVLSGAQLSGFELDVLAAWQDVVRLCEAICG